VQYYIRCCCCCCCCRYRGDVSEPFIRRWSVVVSQWWSVSRSTCDCHNAAVGFNSPGVTTGSSATRQQTTSTVLLRRYLWRAVRLSFHRVLTGRVLTVLIGQPLGRVLGTMCRLFVVCLSVAWYACIVAKRYVAGRAMVPLNRAMTSFLGSQ